MFRNFCPRCKNKLLGIFYYYFEAFSSVFRFINLCFNRCKSDIRRTFLYKISYNGSAAWRRSGLERRNFQLCTNVAKPFFYLLIYKKEQKKNGFWGLNAQMFNLAQNPLFCQTACCGQVLFSIIYSIFSTAITEPLSSNLNIQVSIT